MYVMTMASGLVHGKNLIQRKLLLVALMYWCLYNDLRILRTHRFPSNSCYREWSIHKAFKGQKIQHEYEAKKLLYWLC